MKTSNSKRKIAETLVGAAVGAAIAGPAGAVAGGFAGSQVSGHTAHGGQGGTIAKPAEDEASDPMVHVGLHRILVPLDFSNPSRRALQFAREWAGRFGSEICLLHVIEPVTSVTAFGAEPVVPLVSPVDLRAPVQEELAKLAEDEFPSSMKVSAHVREGAPYDQIAAAARDLGADLIIISTHGRTGISHALLGSTAERVVRHAPCPVLTLRRGGS